MQRSDIRGRIRDRLAEQDPGVGETDATSGFWNNAELNTLIEQAIRYLVYVLPDEFLDQLRTSAQVNWLTTYEYAEPTGYIRMFKLLVNSVEATKLSQDDFGLMADNSYYAASVTEPKYYLWNNKIYIYPAHATGVTNGITYYYVKEQTAMTGASDVPQIAPETHYLLIPLTAYLAFQKTQDRQAMKQSWDEFTFDLRNVTGVGEPPKPGGG